MRRCTGWRHPSRVVAGVTRALKSGGRFVGECGETNNVRRIVGAVSAALEKRGIEIENLHPWRFVSKEEAVGMLEAGGMVVKSVEVIERPTVCPARSPNGCRFSRTIICPVCIRRSARRFPMR